MIPQACSYEEVPPPMLGEVFSALETYFPSPTGPLAWSTANPAVMHTAEQASIPKTGYPNTHSGCLKNATKAIPGGWASHHSPPPRIYTQRITAPTVLRCLPSVQARVSLVLMSLGAMNTAKIPLINQVPPLDQWLALGKLNAVLLVWLPSWRSYR